MQAPITNEPITKGMVSTCFNDLIDPQIQQAIRWNGFKHIQTIGAMGGSVEIAGPSQPAEPNPEGFILRDRPFCVQNPIRPHRIMEAFPQLFMDIGSYIAASNLHP